MLRIIPVRLVSITKKEGFEIEVKQKIYMYSTRIEPVIFLL
jgi:hypothetical protein